jgi:hypothetical protein
MKIDSALVATTVNPDISSGLDLAYFIGLLAVLCVLGGLAIVYVARPYIMAKVATEPNNASPMLEKIDRMIRSLDRTEDDTKSMRESLTSIRQDFVGLSVRVESHEKRIETLEQNYPLLRTELLGMREETRKGMERAHERIDDALQGLVTR